ncbi:MAG: hypothetical protein V5B40_09320 [Candidatus Accumulibacter meliphilus]|jgi:hypothetical protein|uniref:hypothetical protein n=1 Tax=Candidatus Accumulibacter meliphilus TaxID=2211374 RepID=UPI002FC3CA6C
MTIRVVTGRVAKLSVNDASLIFYLGSDPASMSVSTIEKNYNAMASAVFLATANNFEITVKTDSDGRGVSLLTVET